MSRQLTQEQPNPLVDPLADRALLRAAWLEIEREFTGIFWQDSNSLLKLFTKLEHWNWDSDGRTQMLVERMRELAAGHDRHTTDLWELFQAAVGFPIAPRDRLLDCSDPPRITFGPTPWLNDLFIKQHRDLDTNHFAATTQQQETAAINRLPFATDVSEGKGHAIYNAHAYHTKVPHRAIMRYILHYTRPGDVVFDGFCGTGMTGVAAAACGDRAAVEALGFQVNDAGDVLSSTGAGTADPDDGAVSQVGTRHAILMDLSPAATFIASVYNSPIQIEPFRDESRSILEQLEKELGWMYLTLPEVYDTDDGSNGRVAAELAASVSACRTEGELRATLNQATESGVPFCRVRTVAWSDLFLCPDCQTELVFAELAVDWETHHVAKEFLCDSCGALLTKRKLQPRLIETEDLSRPGETIQAAASVPVQIHYEDDRRRQKKPGAFDLALAAAIERLTVDEWHPCQRLFVGRETRRNDRRGVTHLHHFYTRRILRFLAAMRSQCLHRPELMVWFTSQLINLSRLNRYRPGVSFPYNPLSGTLYIGSQVAESNPFIAYTQKLKRLEAALSELQANNTVICGSLSAALLPDDSVDYIFTDPPFGGNLAYSELNLLWESWLDIRTRRNEEAIESRVQDKTPDDYAILMKRCFAQYYRILKPGHWMTVEFHHTQPHVWRAIQDALHESGFQIADIQTLDKQLGTFKQVTNAGSVKQDLVISAIKPRQATASTTLTAGTNDGVWEFITQRLAELPLESPDESSSLTERQAFLLFDRAIAEHLRIGKIFPYSATEFYDELDRRFPKHDGKYFLESQLR